MATLLVVTDTTPARGGGLHLLPRLDHGDASRLRRIRDRVDDRGPFEVRLIHPDGTERTARAVVDVPHVRGPHAPIGMLRLLDVTDVPLGTRVECSYTAVQKWGLASPKRRVEPADFAPIGRFPIDVDRRSVIKTPDDPAS